MVSMNRSKLTTRSTSTFPGYIVTRHSPTLTISYLRLLEAISCSWRHTKERRISLCPYVRRAFFRVWIEWTRREIRRRIFNDVKPIFHFVARTLSPSGSSDEWNSLLCTEYGRKWSKIATITIRRELASRQRENWERKWLWVSMARHGIPIERNLLAVLTKWKTRNEIRGHATEQRIDTDGPNSNRLVISNCHGARRGPLSHWHLPFKR